MTFTDLGEAAWEITDTEIERILTEWSVALPIGGGSSAGAAVTPISTAYIDVGAVPLNGLALDQNSGIVINVEPDGSGISPLIPVPGKTGSVVNPAWVAHKQSTTSAAVQSTINYIPPPDTVTIYSGPGEGPTWEDVYAWTTAEQRKHMTFVMDDQTVSGAELQAAIDSAVGSVIKSLGGFVDQSVQLTALIGQAIMRRLDALQITTYNVTTAESVRIDHVQAQVDAILTLAIPNLQAQITNEVHNAQVNVTRHDEATRAYVHDVWVKPLQSDLATETQQRKLADQSITQSIPTAVRALAPELIAPALAAVAGLATRVGTLEAESEGCVKPMCSVMGPNTPLGNLLKLIKWASLAALLVELGTLTADDVNGLVGQFAHELTSSMTLFRELFVEGGETIGHTLLDAAGRVV